MIPSTEHNFEPMTTGMLLDRATRLYVQNFRLMLSIAAISQIPSIALALLRVARRQEGAPVGTLRVLTELLAILLVFLIAPLTSGATAKSVSDIYLGNSAAFTDVLSETWSKTWILVKVNFVVLFIVIAGIILMVVPGVLWFLSYVLSAPIVMVEGLYDGRKVRRRSWDLVKGNRSKVFFTFVVIELVNLLARTGARFIARFFIGAANAVSIDPIIIGVVSILIAPMFAITVTLLYYDFRIRKEGFDLEMLSKTIGNPTLI